MSTDPAPPRLAELQKLLASPAGPRAVPKAAARLSSRELCVVAELARGGSTEGIAAALGVSPHTVRAHVRNLMRKLEAKSRAHAVAVCVAEAAR